MLSCDGCTYHYLIQLITVQYVYYNQYNSYLLVNRVLNPIGLCLLGAGREREEISDFSSMSSGEKGHNGAFPLCPVCGS